MIGKETHNRTLCSHRMCFSYASLFEKTRFTRLTLWQYAQEYKVLCFCALVSCACRTCSASATSLINVRSHITHGRTVNDGNNFVDLLPSLRSTRARLAGLVSFSSGRRVRVGVARSLSSVLKGTDASVSKSLSSVVSVSCCCMTSVGNRINALLLIQFHAVR